MRINFEWDRGKALANTRKHKVTFEEAATAFGDPLSVTVPDPGEPRCVLIGQTRRGRLVVVVHVDQGETIRIISARFATPHERRGYEEEPT